MQYAIRQIKAMKILLQNFNSIIRPKKIPVVPVSYREKIRVGRSEIIFF
jgi:hypothetical protein